MRAMQCAARQKGPEGVISCCLRCISSAHGMQDMFSHRLWKASPTTGLKVLSRKDTEGSQEHCIASHHLDGQTQCRWFLNVSTHGKAQVSSHLVPELSHSELYTVCGQHSAFSSQS